MRHLRLLAAALLGLVLAAGPVASPAFLSASPGQTKPEKKEVTVWVNTKSGVYHCPGSRWYGKTKQGKYIGECEAQKAGYRPAYHRPCGSDCK